MTVENSIREILERPVNLEEDTRILIVDDDPLILASLEMALKKPGFKIYMAASGEEALDMMESSVYALILCDQLMPGISGIEVMQKAEQLYPDTVRILMTGHYDLETAINAINLGHVNQFLTKPWNEAHLCKIVQDSLERYKLVKENQFLQKLTMSQHQKLEKAHNNLRVELKLGAKIQEELLIGKIPVTIPALDISGTSCPSKDIDGDFFEFYHPVPHILDMVIGDVMGKGIAAALVGTAFKTQMIRFAKPYLFSLIYEPTGGWRDSILGPKEILEQVDRAISGQLVDLEYFVSLLYGRFDLQYKIFSYIDCGFAKPMLFRAKSQEILRLSGENFPIGVIEKQDFALSQVQFSEGDIFVFYSDGVSEARSPENQLFGEERIASLLKNHNEESAENLTAIIRKTALEFTRKDKLDDDLTVVVIKIKPCGMPVSSYYSRVQFQGNLSELRAVRDFVKMLCHKAPGDSDRLSYEMQLVVDEAFCNIVKHGRLDLTKKGIILSAELAESEIIFQLADQGYSYDPSQLNTPSFCGNHDTGYGWHIMKNLSDKINYVSKNEPEGWNRLSIYKRYYLGETKMNITYKIDGKILIITPEGESLDAKDATEFKEKVVVLINNNKLKGVVFDLNKLQFVDSSGLGAFLSVLRLLNSRGEDLKLSHMNKPVRTMFELVKMHKIFDIFNSTEDAVLSFDV